MNFGVIIKYWPRLWSGLQLTLLYSAIAIVLAIVWGVLIGAISYRKPPVIGQITRAYVCFFRETPLLVQLYFLFYGVSRYISVPAGFIGVLALVLNDGAFIAEIVRGGLQSLDPGQREAALSLGFNEFQTMIYFLIPQAWKKVLDSLINMMSIIIKDTSMLMWITICELNYQCNQVNIYSFDPISAYMFGAAVYLALFLIVQGVRRLIKVRSNRIDKRLNMKTNKEEVLNV
ncbi:MAG: amino acid ABC transporter permease [Eubacteriales bacterium]|nr:amino acid ABC transporter permease [Eubacteriales bacterium]